MNGAELIAAERERQVTEEGWTTAHDDCHDMCQLADAALSYLTYYTGPEAAAVSHWPWSLASYKPDDGESMEAACRNLVKAGALIAAEIDRLQRLAAPEGEEL